MKKHCLNYMCVLTSGCVCECAVCYVAKTTIDPVCPECGFCKHCGRKTEPTFDPIIWTQPSYPLPAPTWTWTTPGVSLPYTGDWPLNGGSTITSMGMGLEGQTLK